jgi:glycosyltransferase involved in cell wall biosynthesis
VTRLFAAGDEADLRRALERALADPEGERRGAEATHPAVAARHDWEAITTTTEAVYERVLRADRRTVAS